MKRKEREHLKQDPFQIFIEKTLTFLKKFKKEIYISVIGIVVLVIVISLFLFLQSGSISSENRIYSQALDIQNSETLTLDQKIEKLNRLKIKRGISSSVKLITAAIYFEKGEIAKAKETLDTFKVSKFNLLNDQKKLLEADILSALDKKKEAADLLNRVYSDPESTIGKDFLLVKMARLQIGTNQTSTAITNLKKIGDEFPQSPFNQEARTLLAELENN